MALFRKSPLQGWKKITAKARAEAKKVGVKQSGLDSIIHKARGIKG